jgi:hypothetical protein
MDAFCQHAACLNQKVEKVNLLGDIYHEPMHDHGIEGENE